MTLHWFDNVDDMQKLGAHQAGMNVFPVYEGPFALVHDMLAADGVSPGARQNIELANAKIFKVTVGADEYIPVVLCRLNAAGNPEWTIYCGDHQVTGDQKEDGKHLAKQLRADGVVSNSVANACEDSNWVGKVPTLTKCAFFNMLRRGFTSTPPKINICSHTKAVLSQLQVPDLEAMGDELKSWKSGAAVAMSVVSAAMSPEEATFYDAAFIQHVLLAGERGSGKSTLARQAADRMDAVYLEMQMHPSMEPWEFRAHDRAWNGQVYTVLGKLAEAVHWIQQGKKVVLCMDEFLNMNPTYATVINSPLTLTDRDTYLIETGRILDLGDGIGRTETAEVPADMLWVVATSNIGARYGLDKIAPSVRGRFLIIMMNTNPDRTKKILEKNLAKYEMPLEFAEMFQKFLTACNTAVDQNTLDEEATTRLACNVVRAVHLKAKRDRKRYPTVKEWLPVIKAQVLAEIAQVVNFELGPLDPDQEAIYKSLVDASFKVK